ncbi:MAG: hypothetical protein WDW38_007047 [Sanguina aurantia]
MAPAGCLGSNMSLGEDASHFSHTHASHAMPMTHSTMAMYFVNSIKVTLWSEHWTTDSYSSYATALFALFCLGVAYEHLATHRRG